MPISTQSGGLGTNEGGSSRSSDPPVLEGFSDDARYDLATVVQLVGVRPIILWAWEQQLGLSQNVRFQDEMSASARRYSERDVSALLWLRDQILGGLSVNDAVARLLAGQPGAGGKFAGGQADTGRPRVTAGPLLGSRVNTGPLPAIKFTAPPRNASITQRLAEVWGASTTGDSAPPLPQPAMPPVETKGPHSSGLPLPVAGPNSQGLGYGNAAAGFPPELVHRSPPSHPLWMGTGAANAAARDLRAWLTPLLRAFAAFDTQEANRIMAEALVGRNVEMVCANLLQPAVERVGELWARREVSSPEEHFALNYARGLLFSLFHMTSEVAHAPLVFVGCGPKEVFDLHALMLAVFWRRAGLRVVYLGGDVDGPELVQIAAAHHARLVALSVSTAQRVRALSRIAKAIGQQPSPRPLFCFGGGVFVRSPDLQRKVAGIYLGDDVAQATFHVRRLLNLDRTTTY